MTQFKWTAFVPNLVLGIGVVIQSSPHVYAASIVIDPSSSSYDVTVVSAFSYIPIIYYYGSNDQRNPGFYHQFLLIQKANDIYVRNQVFEYNIEPTEEFIYDEQYQY